MRNFSKYLKGILITIVSLVGAFGLSLIFHYIFDVREHITTIFVFAVFLISLLTEGYIYGVLGAFIGTIAVNYASFDAMETGKLVSNKKIEDNEAVIDFTNGALTRFLIKLSSMVEQSDEQVIGSYFHVLNDLERIGDHAENFYEIVAEMAAKSITFSEKAQNDIK